MRWHAKSRTALFLTLCAIWVACASVWISWKAYEFRPLTTDEHSYLFQAQLFREGRFQREFPPTAFPFFQPMTVLDLNMGWFSRYPPVHALWLLPGLVLGWPLLMSYLAAAASLLLLAACASRLKLSPLPAILLAVSPFFLFMHGTLLSHTSALLSTTGMLWAYFCWQETRNTRFAALAGLCWGLLFLNRSYTAALFVLPFGAHACWTGLFPRPRDWKGVCTFAGVSAVFPILYKVYNKLVTGSSRRSTFLAYDRTEGLGFGMRHLRGLPVEHSLRRGLENTWTNFMELDLWLFGFRGGLLLLLGLTLLGWRKRWTPLLLAAPIFLWAGYVFYWFPGIEHFRPVYSFETLPFLLLGAGMGLDRLRRIRYARPAAAVALLLLLCFQTIPFSREQQRRFQERNAPHAELARTLRSLPPNSVAVLENLGNDTTHENMLNLRGLDSDPLVVRSEVFANLYLRYFFPDRSFFLIRGDSSAAHPFSMDFSDPPVWGPALFPAQTGDVQSGTRIASPAHAPGYLCFARLLAVPSGIWHLRFDLAWTDVAEDAPLLLDVVGPYGHGTHAIRTLHGAAERHFLTVELSTDTLLRFEPRLAYKGSGTLHFYGMQLLRVDANSRL